MRCIRLFNIIYSLLEQERVTVKELAAEHRVTTRTISRDIAVLEEAHIPLEKEVGFNGGISLMKGYKLDKAFLTEKERLMLKAGMNKVAGDYQVNEVKQLMRKLGLET